MTVTMNLASSAQLEMIDGLRGLGISDIIALPQLAVVGDQSSGKSSVLEALSGQPFPRDSGLCTRFATQIIFRRETTTNIKIGIIPGPERTTEEARRMRDFVVRLDAFSGEVFLNALSSASQVMGITDDESPTKKAYSTFSDDMLSIEISGPEQQNLSIIDTPGIFRTPTEGLTTGNDMALVRKIMMRHIKDERTIILAVIPTNTDIATQEILSIAKEVDPKGIRTLGVLTKPDLIDKGGEENVLQLVENKRNPLRLGYHIVRNRGQSELSNNIEERNSLESNFFAKDPWTRLDRARLGMAALQRRLQNLLVDITRREFPKVRTQIMTELTSRRHQLDSLGTDRNSTDQQRHYLLELSHAFRGLVDSALDAYYSRDAVFSQIPDLKIATLAITRMDEFSKQIEKCGYTAKFSKTATKKTTNTYSDSESEDEDDMRSRPLTGSTNDQKPPAATTDKKIDITESSSRLISSTLSSKDNLYSELSSINLGELKISWNQRNILDLISDEYKNARGLGMATIGPSIVPTIWQEQTKNWIGISLQFIGDMIFMVHNFICKALSHLCFDELVRGNILTKLQDQLLAHYEKAIDHVRFLLEVERLGTPLTTNHYYNDNLQKCKANRLKSRLEKHAEVNYNHRGDQTSRRVVHIDAVTQVTNMDNADHTIQEIHDILMSYYKVARKRFVDNVCMQGSDYCLLTGKNSPLRLFDTSFVSSLSDAELQEMAGEDDFTRQFRKELIEKIAALEKGKKLLKL